MESADGKRTFPAGIRRYDAISRRAGDFDGDSAIDSSSRTRGIPHGAWRAEYRSERRRRLLGFAASQKERGALVNQGFDVVQADLSGGDTLAGLDLLVVAWLQRPLVETERTAIRIFLMPEETCCWRLEPGRADNLRRCWGIWACGLSPVR